MKLLKKLGWIALFVLFFLSPLLVPWGIAAFIAWDTGWLGTLGQLNGVDRFMILVFGAFGYLITLCLFSYVFAAIFDSKSK